MSVAILTSILGVILGAGLTWVIGYVQQGELWRRLRNVILDKHHLSLNEEFLLSQMLADKIAKSGFKPDTILAVSPGGGMIAEWLARAQLGKFEDLIPVRSICVHSQRTTTGVPTLRPTIVGDIHGVIADLATDSKILLVIDISRGGESLRVAQEQLLTRFAVENIKTAALISHVHSRTKPDFRAIDTGKAVYFDWKNSL